MQPRDRQCSRTVVSNVNGLMLFSGRFALPNTFVEVGGGGVHRPTLPTHISAMNQELALNQSMLVVATVASSQTSNFMKHSCTRTIMCMTKAVKFTTGACTRETTRLCVFFGLLGRHAYGNAPKWKFKHDGIFSAYQARTSVHASHFDWRGQKISTRRRCTLYIRAELLLSVKA